MKTAARWEDAMADRMIDYTGLFVIGALAWTCDFLGVTAQPPAVRPAVRPMVRGARS